MSETQPLVLPPSPSLMQEVVGKSNGTCDDAIIILDDADDHDIHLCRHISPRGRAATSAGSLEFPMFLFSSLQTQFFGQVQLKTLPFCPLHF